MSGCWNDSVYDAAAVARSDQDREESVELIRSADSWYVAAITGDSFAARVGADMQYAELEDEEVVVYGAVRLFLINAREAIDLALEQIDARRRRR